MAKAKKNTTDSSDSTQSDKDISKEIVETSSENVTPVEVVDTEAASNDAKKKRRLKPAAPSIREQTEKATAQAEKAGGTDQPQRNAFVKLIRLPFLIVLWPIRLLFRYIIVPPFRFLNRFKFFRIIGYIFVPPFFRSAFRELKGVTWPTTRETYRLVVAVLIFSIIFGLLVAGIDYVLDKLFREVILK